MPYNTKTLLLHQLDQQVVSLPTADERKRMEQQGRAVPDQVYTEKVDIWAAGILAYELLVGKPPFEVDDEVETRRRIMYETTLNFPPNISADAVGFIKAALAKNAGMRPEAAELVHHAWLRPHLAAALGGGAAAPMDSKSAALAALRQRLPEGAAGGGGGAMGRSVSFSTIAAGGGGHQAHRPPGLTVAVADDSSVTFSSCGAFAAGSSVSASAACGAGGGALGGGGRAAAPASPTGNTPTTPGPYGPPGAGRKPIWEVDPHAAPSYQAVRTTGLSGEVPSSPSSTSPGRSKLSGGPGQLAASTAAGGGGFGGGGGNPLLKAALNSSLHKMTHAAGAAAAPAAGSKAASANVKLRIKEYFVARSTNEASVGGGTLTG
jgi:hypothetical protein